MNIAIEFNKISKQQQRALDTLDQAAIIHSADGGSVAARGGKAVMAIDVSLFAMRGHGFIKPEDRSLRLGKALQREPHSRRF